MENKDITGDLKVIKIELTKQQKIRLKKLEDYIKKISNENYIKKIKILIYGFLNMEKLNLN